MTYAMTLDNSWEIMNEDEMYDVNGGGWFSRAYDKVVKMFADIIVATLSVTTTAKAAVWAYTEFATAQVSQGFFYSLKAAVFNWKVLLAVVVLAVASIYAIYIY